MEKLINIIDNLSEREYQYFKKKGKHISVFLHQDS